MSPLPERRDSARNSSPFVKPSLKPTRTEPSGEYARIAVPDPGYQFRWARMFLSVTIAIFALFGVVSAGILVYGYWLVNYAN